MKRMQTDRRDGWNEITPKDAADILSMNHKNRALSEARARGFANDITSGRWKENGEPIILDKNGRLYDGQHRLRAVVISGKPIVSYVVHLNGVSREGLFDTIDSGKSRSASDRLSIVGVANSALTAAAVRMISAWENGVRRGIGGGAGLQYKLTNADIRRRYETTKKAVDYAVTTTCKWKEQLTGWAPTSIVCFVFYEARQIDMDKAERWLTGLATGQDLPADSAVLALRNRLQKEAMTATGKLTRDDILVAMIKSWNLYAGGVPAKKIQIGLLPDEAFPEFGA